jgi:hypothetical protein
VEPSHDVGVHLDADNLFLVRPDPEFADERSEQSDEADSGFVGVVLRGSARSEQSGAPRGSDSFRRIRADLEYLIAGRPVIASEITPILDPGRDVELPEAHASNLSEVLEQVTNRFIPGEGAVGAVATAQRGEENARGAVAGDTVALTVSLLDQLIDAARAQLRLLTKLRAAQAASGHEQVTLQTPTGPLPYTLPLSLNDTYSSTEVSEILSPTGKGHRTIAQTRRQANELLGVKIGSRYRYPKFQIDPTRHEVRPVVAHANRLLECDADPWGSLDWWFSADEGLGRRRPIDLLENHELSYEVVDFAIERVRQGMG